jgi:hypothetical protein
VSSTGTVPGRPALLGVLIRAATPAASLRRQDGRRRLAAAVARMRGSWRARTAWIAGALVAIGVVCVRERSAHRTPIAWRVESGDASARGFVSVPRTAPTARLVFGDGSDVSLAPGSRGRVAATTSAGATVVLEDGRARVQVPPRGSSRWLVAAGPFALRTSGAELLVAWSSDDETLEIWTGAGRVEVTGPALVDALSLAAGQHVRALHDGTLHIDVEGSPPSRDLGSEPCAVR